MKVKALTYRLNEIQFFGLILFLVAGCGASQEQVASVGIQSAQMSDDGAWCWFQDPRAVFIQGKPNVTVAGWMTSDGMLEMGMYNHDTGNTVYSILEEDWDINDHNTSSFLVLPDSRLAVFYARHNKKGLFMRRSQKPADISSWEEEIIVSDEDRITYNHPVYLAAEDKYYVFWRGPSWKPTMATSSDLINWSEEQILLQEAGKESEDVRPYLKVATDNDSTIHLAFTNGHPRNESHNSIYYMQYRGGRFYNAEGIEVGSIDSLSVQIQPEMLVYDAGDTGARSWIWDVAADESGNPVIAYTRLPAETDHRYHYARWNGTEWLDNEIVAAGPWFPQTREGEQEREVHYSGGISLDHADPSRLYLARQINGQFEIERWKTRDAGLTWTGYALTADSEALNVRPVVPRGYTGMGDLVLWMAGSYVHYTEYNTRIMIHDDAE